MCAKETKGQEDKEEREREGGMKGSYSLPSPLSMNVKTRGGVVGWCRTGLERENLSPPFVLPPLPFHSMSGN